MSQNREILEYLKTGKSITAAEAVRKFGCYRLAARISDLRQAGHEIISESVTQLNRYGEKVQFASYRLKGAR